MKREFPAFMIDRSRRAPNTRVGDDYVVCVDDSVGFVAKIYKLNRTQFAQHNSNVNAMGEDAAECRYCTSNLGDVVLVLEVVKLLHPPLTEKAKLKSLMKKALKAYMFGEVAATQGDGSAIDKQIGVVEEMERLSRSQYDSLVLNNGVEAADEIISQLHAAWESLGLLKKIMNANYGRS